MPTLCDVQEHLLAASATDVGALFGLSAEDWEQQRGILLECAHAAVTTQMGLYEVRPSPSPSPNPTPHPNPNRDPDTGPNPQPPNPQTPNPQPHHPPNPQPLALRCARTSRASCPRS